MHDRVYMCSLRHPSLLFLYKGTMLHFCLLTVALKFYTLNKHSIIITNASDDLSLDDKTVIVSYVVFKKV